MNAGSRWLGRRSLVIAAAFVSAVGLGLGALGVAGGDAVTPAGHGCPAPGGPAGRGAIMGSDETAGIPGRKAVPPLDLEAPDRAEIAVFGLG